MSVTYFDSGYSSLGSELTKGAVDQREQFDFGTPYECKWKPGDPDYLKLWGPPQVILVHRRVSGF